LTFNEETIFLYLRVWLDQDESFLSIQLC